MHETMFLWLKLSLFISEILWSLTKVKLENGNEENINFQCWVRKYEMFNRKIIQMALLYSVWGGKVLDAQHN